MSQSPDPQDTLVAARNWLILGIFSLVAAGLLALLLVLARTPGVGTLLPYREFFRTALVVHVNLSVLVWFLGFSAVLWTTGRPRGMLTAHIAPLVAWTGTLLVTATPFLGEGRPLLNNYVPILQHPAFLWGLALVGAGMLPAAVHGVLHPGPSAGFTLATRCSALTTLLAATVLAFTAWRLPAVDTATARYELLFWGAGHVLQFSHTLLLLLCWALLAGLSLDGRRQRAGLWLAFLPVLATPLIELAWTPGSAEHRIAYTRLMQYGGLAALPLGAWLAWQGLAPAGRLRDAQRAALTMSVLLFATGGVLGFLIEGVNVVIPAHYHGAIVGVTLAFMGVAYQYLPRLGHPLALPRLARWQPVIYGGGQLLHILGLAWSGGYGVQRKVAGAEQGLDSLGKVLGMGMMGLGGLIAILGGLFFVVVMIASLTRRRRS